MDQRLIATVPLVLYLVVGSLFAVALSAAHLPLEEGQPTFLALAGLVAPLFAIGLIWLRNYVYGPPLLVGSMLATAWFVGYFFLVHDNPSNVRTASGDAAAAATASTVALVVVAFGAAVVGCWLWYRERPGFRSAVDRVLRPSE